MDSLEMESKMQDKQKTFRTMKMIYQNHFKVIFVTKGLNLKIRLNHNERH